MKKFIISSITICFIIAIVFFVRNQISIQKSKVLTAKITAYPTDTPTPSPIAWKQSTVINLKNASIRISWAQVDPKDVILYSNLKEQKLSEEIWVNGNCKVLVNGGFYSKENTHLGLFVSNYSIVSKKIKSPLLNGFLWINDNNISIENNIPDINPRVAVQSGPLLMQDGNLLPLAINNDEPNRRIVAGTTPDNKLIFLAVYRDGSIYQGPLLGQLPEIISLFKKQTKINIINAINLDGGSASVFISNYDRLNELVHIGSYFCAK
jgi:uncharacterized protein YigE (DUF2233 family)